MSDQGPNLQQAFAAQARACLAMGAPFTASVIAGVWDNLDASPHLLARLHAWSGDVGPKGASLPLRVAGGLHHLARAGAMPEWTAIYPVQGGHPGSVPPPDHLIRRVLAAQDDWLTDFVANTPQTNETGRSAVLLAAAAWLTQRYGLPLRLSELGASAGLNLNFDHYALDLGAGGCLGDDTSPLRLAPDWRGSGPPQTRLRVVEKRGVDLNPLDPVADGARLMAYVWPDQPARMNRLAAALTLATRHPVTVDRADAGAWLAARLAPDAARPLGDHCHLIYHTIAHQYFPARTQAQIADSLGMAGARADAHHPLAHLGMEADETPGSAAITLRLWPGDVTIPLGRAGFHGEWVDWRAP